MVPCNLLDLKGLTYQRFLQLLGLGLSKADPDPLPCFVTSYNPNNIIEGGGWGGAASAHTRIAASPLQAPDPQAPLAILVAQPLEVARGKAAPGVVHTRHNLDALQEVAILGERTEVLVQHVLVLVEHAEQLLAGLPSIKGHQVGVDVILAELHD